MGTRRGRCRRAGLHRQPSRDTVSAALAGLHRALSCRAFLQRNMRKVAHKGWRAASAAAQAAVRRGTGWQCGGPRRCSCMMRCMRPGSSRTCTRGATRSSHQVQCSALGAPPPTSPPRCSLVVGRDASHVLGAVLLVQVVAVVPCGITRPFQLPQSMPDATVAIAKQQGQAVPWKSAAPVK